MARVTVFRDPYVRSWPERKPLRRQDRGYVLELGDALERPYTTDAHMACYATPNSRRLNREALAEGVTVEMTAVAFDVDAPGHEATPEWRVEMRERVRALAAVHPQPYYYETRGGCRIVYRQDPAGRIASDADAIEWSRAYAVAVVYLLRRFGIAADPACADWQRLYRLPRATRDPGGRAENNPIWGDPERIGTLQIDAAATDVRTAAAASRAFRAAQRYDFRPWEGAGDGELHRLLAARGDIIAERRGGWLIRCPQEHAHTTGRTGDGSTILYPPAPKKTLGQICCLHAHCSGLSAVDWLRLLGANTERRAA